MKTFIVSVKYMVISELQVPDLGNQQHLSLEPGDQIVSLSLDVMFMTCLLIINLVLSSESDMIRKF